MNFHDAIERCTILGGDMPFQNIDFDTIKNITTSETWVPIVYRKGEWNDFYTDEPLSNLPWNDGEPNGFEREPCVHTTAGGGKLNDNSCQAYMNTLCHFSSYATKLRLRGITDFEEDFIFEPEKNQDLLEFQNLRGMQKIVYLDNLTSWALITSHYEVQQSEIIALLKSEDSNQEFPLGNV